MAADPNRVKNLPLGAAEQVDEIAQLASLDHAFGGNAGVRDRTEELLLSHASDSSRTMGLDAAISDGGSPGADADGAYDGLQFLSPPGRPDSLGRLGHYEVLEVLGQGGFGIVFRAFDEMLQRVVAIKVLSPQMASNSPARKRFLREARSSAKVRHENVVQIFAVEEEPLPYLVMEFIPGETLQQQLDRTGPLEPPEVLHIGRQIAEGLAAAHTQGLIHRDIKPGNILLEAGPNQHVKITDFGLARAADDASLTQSGVLAGTPMFMAPEQASADTLDHRADLFSLGSVLYTVCSGRPPFRANSTLAVLKRVVEDTPRPIREIIPEVPQWLCDLIARLHAKNPDGRIATAREVADLLGRGLAALQSPGTVKPPSVAAPAAVKKSLPSQDTLAAAPTAAPRLGSHRWLAAAAVFLTLLGGLGFTEATGVTNVRGTVIRLFSPEGTLVIQVDDPEVSVQIDGEDLVITGAGAREIRLKTGRYTVEARKDGKTISRELVTVTKNGRQVVRVSQEAAATDLTNTLGMKFKLIPAGKFTMGSPIEEVERLRGILGNEDGYVAARLPVEVPEHLVAVAQPFYMGTTEVTVGQFRQFVEEARYQGDAQWNHVALMQTDDHPVYRVSWQNAVDFCNWLSAKEGKKYRLPTEAEWEYCCRAGKSGTRYCFGDDEAQLENFAWFKGNSGIETHPVGQKKPNAWGLYDMHGNVWEWCQDWYQADYYKNSPMENPPGGVGDMHAIRGGSLGDGPVACRSAFRYDHPADIGFRVLLVLTPAGGGTQSGPKEKGGEQTSDPGRRAASFTDADVKRIASLPAAAQVEAIRTELMRRSPDFRGRLIPTIKDGAVTGLRSQDVKPSLADLLPLRGMKLTSLNLTNHSRVTDLTPLRGMPLEELSVWPFLGSDLTPLQGMPLKNLNIGGGVQKLDLTPLAGMPLEYLCVNHSQTSDLTPLKNMPLKHIEFTNTKVTDFAPLRSIKSLETINQMPAPKFWKSVAPPGGVRPENGPKEKAGELTRDPGPECTIAWDGGVIKPAKARP